MIGSRDGKTKIMNQHDYERLNELDVNTVNDIEDEEQQINIINPLIHTQNKDISGEKSIEYIVLYTKQGKKAVKGAMEPFI